MNPLTVPGPFAAVSDVASVLSSVSRIVKSNNWRETEIYAIEKAAEVNCNRIIYNARYDKNAIDFCYAQALAALGSSKLSSEQKRELVILMADKISQI